MKHCGKRWEKCLDNQKVVFTGCKIGCNKYKLLIINIKSGERGIRTPATRIRRKTDFESVPFNRSGISPFLFAKLKLNTGL